MPDTFTEVTSNSWFGRIGKSIIGVFIGLAMLLGSVCLIYWNESRAVRTAKSLKEGAAAVVSVDAASVAPVNERKLIHISGEATTQDKVTDPMFAISADALRLSRTVSMYQWTEKEKSEERKKLGGGTETVKTYTYDKAWEPRRIDSSHFKHPEGHTNPGTLLAEQFSATAKQITLGAFTIPPEVSAKMKGDQPLVPTEADLGKLPANLKAKAKLTSDGFYFGGDPAAPAVGDQKVAFKALKPATFSILAQQVGNRLAPYPTKAGDEIVRVESGTVTAQAMFAHAASENAMLTWILRLVGFIVMSIGIGLVFGPISVFGDVIPFIGNILGAGVGIAAILLGLFGSLITIAIAWVVVRPLLGVLLIVAAVGVFVFARKLGRSTSTPPPPPPVPAQ